MKHFHFFINLISSPRNLLVYLLTKISFIFPDEIYLKIKFWLKIKRSLNLETPQSYNEKLQWLKLYYRNPLYQQMVDKIEVKKYVENIIGDNYIIPTIAVLNSVNEIDFENLPNQFVIKCSHDSGGIVVCKDKTKLNREKAKAKIKKGLKTNYFLHNREWPYKNIKPRIIIEHYMEDESGYELKDYKFFCFYGTPKLFYIASDRGVAKEKTKFDYYDMDFNHLPFTSYGHPNSSKKLKKPKGFDEMVELAKKLSAGIPHVRVDFYDINGKVFFGEFTFFHMSGTVPIVPDEWDFKLGEFLELPKEKIIN